MLEFAPDFNRFATTIEHEEPDRVPLAEIIIGYRVMSRFLGREVTDDDVASQVEFWVKAGYDYVPLVAGVMRPGGITKDSQISKVLEQSIAKDADGEEWNIFKKPRIRTEADLDHFPWDALANLDLGKFDEVQQYLPEGMKIIVLSGKIFTTSWMLMGFENFATNLLLNPGFTGEVIERVARIQLGGLRRLASLPNVAAVWAVDDIAVGTGPIMSMGSLREFIFPWYEEFGKICRQHGRYFFFHSDGVMWDLLEDLIALGVDALHPIDPTCMDIEEVKQKVGSRLCLLGNIANQLLEDGTAAEVEEITRQRLRAVAPGGGYALGSGNSVTDDAKIENFRAMIEMTRRHGAYPIRIPRI